MEQEQEQIVKVTMTLKEYRGYQRYLKRKRLREVTAVLRKVESEVKEQKVPCPKVSDWQQRREKEAKEEAEELAEQRRFDALTCEEQVAEVLRWIEADKS
jgi:predicted secreted protein